MVEKKTQVALLYVLIVLFLGAAGGVVQKQRQADWKVGAGVGVLAGALVSAGLWKVWGEESAKAK